MSATGGLLVKGTAVTLGGTSSHIQQALGAISVVATSGSISKDTGGLTLQANAGGLSGGALTLDAGTNAIALGTGANAATLLGGTAGHLSDVVLRGDAGITAGTIAARSLQTVGNAAMLTAGGAITLGDLTLSQPSYIQTTGAGSMLTVGSVTVGNVAAPALLANSLTLETLGANSDIVANTASGQALTAEGNVTLRAAGNIRLGAAEAKTGGVSLTAGGDITGMILGAAASDGRVAPAYGRANVAADAANQTVTITAANGLAQLGEVTAGSGGALAAPSFDQLVVSAKAIDALSVVAANGRLSLSASTNDLTLGSGLAADDATLVAQGNLAVGTLTSSFGNISATAVTGNVTGLALATPISDGRVSTGFGLAGFAAPSTGKAITITAGGLAQLGAITTGSNGAITVRSNQIYLGDQVQATSGTIDLINRADVGPANITAVGDGLVDIAPGSFVLSNAQIGRLSASNVFITTEQAAGVIQNVSLGQFVLGAGTGSSRFAILANNAATITLNGAITGNTSATIQIGGDATVDSGIGSIPLDATTLAARIVGKTAAVGGAEITVPNAKLDLRAKQIVFGLGNLLTDPILVSDNAASIAANLVSNETSSLYEYHGYGSRIGKAYITASSLGVRYADYALFQNTGPSPNYTGVVLGPLATQGPNPPVTDPTGPLALSMDAGDSAGNANAFALFGQINGLVGRSASLLSDAVVSYSTNVGGAQKILITLAHTRLNGCSLGSPTIACLVRDLPIPNLNIFKDNQTQIFSLPEDTRIVLDPVIGTNNDALIGDIASLPDSPIPGNHDADACGSKPDCPRKGEAH